ncbi:unnamed protein product [Triticum turgidum subsp. durum]|uniref:Malectin-like domain-containing protein n=1 Tax=Triticum turgidum subsp. durum TaxID=4567 RepID=A0A9R0VB41_TRITD|nr:unnamed protein product [Triticum turgidum subsp. durum]
MCACSGMGRAMVIAARPWLRLLLGLAAAAGVLQVRGQRTPSITGFISIDCGLPEQGGYVDAATKIPYTSDAGFTDAGSNRDVSAEYMDPRMPRTHLNVRSFPDTARGCYTLPSLTPGSKYLVRATFRYGNYDGLNKLPAFDLYLGVNFWRTVNVSKVDAAVVAEAIAVIPDDSVQVCLVNVGSGTPFISALALRPLENSLYPQANATQALVLIDRRSLGDTGVLPIRYPDDPYDRAWVPWSDPEVWTDISTTEKVRETIGNLRFHVPSAVMQTAIIASNDSRNQTIDFSWDVEPNHAYPVPGCIGILYVAELQILASNDVREFNVIANGKKNKLPYTLEYLVADAISNREPHHGYNQYN